MPAMKPSFAHPTEQQPLLATVPISAVPPPHPLRHTFTRIVTQLLSSGLICTALGLFVFSSWLTFPSDYVASVAYRRWYAERLPLEMLEELMLLTPQEDKARANSQYYTSGPHLGGKNLSQAIWTRDLWKSYGLESEIVAYDIYVNYPKSHRLGLLRAESLDSASETRETIDGRTYELLYEASLEEDVVEEDPTTALKDRIPTFHGYSANGNVTAEFIYTNYATYQDFEDLLLRGVNITGKIVICKYGQNFRGLKVKRAQELGAVGVIIYSDPGDDGNITELNGYKAYPKGPARNPSSVQRGSVNYLSFGPGDPTTPGYASKPGVPRQDPSKLTPSIPSIPISYADAIPILRALNNCGLSASDLGARWLTGGLYTKDVKYNIGPAAGITLNFVNQVEYEITPMWNVIGKIPGHIKDEMVILGNHRDAWVAGGAGDPNSGSAAMNEMARSFGKMLQIGWKPARTLMLASWDGEEYALLGSTEWVEDNQAMLSTGSLAYINVDVGVRTAVFALSVNPLLQDVVVAATKKVIDPNSAEAGNFSTSIYDIWDKRIYTLGSGSDYTAFQDFLAIPSVDMGFSGQTGANNVYHYHSNYDSQHWMSKFGDPGFKYHVAMAKVWGLIALQLTESLIVQFNVTRYATELGEYLSHIKVSIHESCSNNDPRHPPCSPHHKYLLLRHLSRLEHSIHRLQHHARKHDARAARLADELSKPVPWWRRLVLCRQARRTNSQYKAFDRVFVHKEGLDDRPWFKHVVYAPGKWTGYSGATFPGLIESISDRNWTNAVRWSRIIHRSVDLASFILEN